MEFIKKLSERGVELYKLNSELFVKRYLTELQIKNILEFYKESTFLNKPEIIDKNQKFILEKYLSGKIVDNPNFLETKKIVDSLLELSNEKIGNIDLKKYLEENYNRKINSINLGEKEIEVVSNFFNEIQKIALKEKINLNWTHGDLKGDNIIYKDGKAFFIDWEWVKKGHYIEDIQKFIQHTLKYNKVKTDDFLNNFYKYKNINWKLFLFLEGFHYFLNQILQLSKKRISLDNFKFLIDNKFNSIVNSNIFYISYFGKKIKICTTSNLSDIFHEEKEADKKDSIPYIMFDNNNNQEQRLTIYKKLILEFKNLLVLHGISFRLKNGENILLGGPSGSGKSFIFNKIQELGLVEELYDEDLIVLDNKGNLLPLGNKVFKGNINGKYLYEEINKKSFGKINKVLYIDNSFYGLKKSTFSNENLKRYLIHERYLENGDLLEIYSNFNLPKNVESFIIGNNKKNNNFKFLEEILGNTIKENK